MDHRSSYFEDLVLFSLQLFDVLWFCMIIQGRSAPKKKIEAPLGAIS